MNDSSTSLHDFQCIAREHTPALSRYLRRHVGDDDIASDLLQDTLFKASLGLAGYAGRASVKTWLFAIAGNVVNDFLRSPARRRQIVAMDEAEDIEDDALAVDDRLDFDEMNRCVRDVIDSLPPDYRTALILHDLEGLDCERTAEVMGGSVGAAKVRIHRARQRLKAALERSCGFYHDSDSVLRCERRD